MESFDLNASQKTKSTPAGKIPVDWECVPLGRLFKVQLGKMLDERARSGPNQQPYLGNSDVRWRHFDLSHLNTMHFSETEIEQFELKVGDLLICEGGEVGRAAIWRGEQQPCFYQKALHRLRPLGSDVSSEFMLNYMEMVVGTKLIKNFVSTTSIAHLTREKLLLLPVSLPPIDEQHKIAAILANWNKALEKLNSLIEIKERRRKTLMQRLLTGTLRLPKFGNMPWHTIRMNIILTRIFRPIEWTANKPLSLVSLRRRCGGLFRRAGVLGADYKTQDLHELKADDFLISKRQVAHGAWAMVTPEFEGSHVSKEYSILVGTAPEKLYMPFFAWLAQTPRIVRLARVASTGVHIEKLIFDTAAFLRESIRIPATLAEQQQIAQILNFCATEIRLLRSQRAAIEQQKRGLMQRLLTGKVRVKPDHPTS